MQDSRKAIKKETKPKNNNIDAFQYENNTFPVQQDGSYLCAFCETPQKRLMSHLEKKCKHIQDIKACRTAFNVFRNRRSSILFQQKHKDNAGFKAKVRDASNKYKAKKKDEDQVTFDDKNKKQKQISRARCGSAPQRINKFKSETMYGPIFICCCCHRRLFKKTVAQFNDKIKQSIAKEAPGILERCIYTNSKIPELLLVDIGKGPQAWLCHTCKTYLKQDRMPPMCSRNNLQIDEHDLSPLSELEASLISPNILYMKITALPVSRMSALNGKVTNVPIRPEDRHKTLTKIKNASLPRTPDEAGLIAVTLKKKMTFSSHYLKAFIDVNKIFPWLHLFKAAGHPYYQDEACSPEQYQLKCAESDPEDYSDSSKVTDQDNSEDSSADVADQTEEQEEQDFQTNDPVRKHQFSYNKSVILTDTNPEDRVVTLAPGEDQTPEHILSSPNWDIKAFPHLNNPDGSNGLNDPTRQVKLPLIQFFQQKVLNVNKKFAKSPTYVYAAVHAQEKKQIASNMSLAYTNGHQVTGSDGRISFQSHDAYNVLSNIKNSPKFWRLKKAEFISKLDSFGPFHWFFSLSCAEKRWNNNMTAILRDLPDVISIEHNLNTKTDDGFNKEKITVNSKEHGSIPLTDYISLLPSSQYELIKDNIITATRVFDQRLQAFIKNIVMGKDNPMNVLLYSYRIEFQRRGAPHAHGVIWMNMSKMERVIPGLTQAYKNLRQGNGVKDPVINSIEDEAEQENNAKPLTQMIDKFTTCSLHPGTVGSDVVQIVQDVNKHRHTKSCKKRGTKCRFNIPKMPSEQTVICQPYTDKEDFDKAEKALDKVRSILNNDEAMKAIWDKCPDKGHSQEDYIMNRKTRIMALCQEADVPYEDYKSYLKMGRSGYTVVLQRDIDEVFINSYNPEWIRAWDANLDIQPVLDFFAVITYVTEYAWKPEPGESDINKVLESCNDDKKEQMKAVSNTFLTTREMGESEAAYKVISSLSMTGANNSAQWVSLDRPEDKTKRMRRVPEQDQQTEQNLIKIEDRDGLWMRQWDMQDKYKRRSQELNKICFSQYSRMYTATSRSKPGDTEDIEVNEEGTIEQHLIQEDEQAACDPFSAFKTLAGCNQDCCQGAAIPLPELTRVDKPHKGEQSQMKLRQVPCALRYYKANKDKNPYKYFLQELMLYVPNGLPEHGTINDLGKSDKFCTEDLFTLTNEELFDVYNHNTEHIIQVKAKVMPYLEDVEEQRFYVEEANKLLDTSRIGDELAPEREQDNDDALIEGDHDDPDYQHIDPDNIDIPQEVKTSDYGRIQVPNKKELQIRTRKLDKDQRRVVDIIITYCKELDRAMTRQSPVPPPPHLMVHGAAGTGKSTVIDIATQWAQLIFQKSGDNPEQPYILKCAFTGTAAANIGGNTLTSAFRLQYGNEHFSLSDKERDKMRVKMKNLKILVIDEISLVKSDMLYQLDLKLQEIKENPGVPFGGVLIAAFGDIFQLKPVLANYIFAKPRNPAFLPTYQLASRWEMLQVINLETNHRQGEDGDFADLLNRIRFVKRGELLPEDIKTLEERVRPTDHPDNQGTDMSIVCTLSKAQQINADYLNQLPGETTTITATCYKANQKDFKPQVNEKDGSIAKTGFIHKLDLKIGAKIMMVKNIDTSDGLTNGQTGVLIDMTKNKNGDIDYLLIKFDREQAGREARSRNPQLSLSHPGCTKIKKESLTYSLNKKGGAATATLIQFPIRLAKAVTAHKVQGLTVYQPSTINLDISSAFEPAQGYVMLGRAQSLKQIFIMDQLKPNSLHASHEALVEYDKMNKRALNNKTSGWFPQQPEAVKIASLNVCRLQPHFEDILSDPTLLKADIIHFCETWLLPDQDLNCFKIPGYYSNFLNIGPGRGIVTFYKESFQPAKNISKDDYQITMFRSDAVDSIHIYRSSNGSISSLIEDLQVLIQSSTTIITGDFNICLKDNPNNKLTTFLRDQGFNQINKSATHDAGRQIDHVYISDPDNTFDMPSLLRFSPYYSDHDALCTTLKPAQVGGPILFPPVNFFCRSLSS